MRNRKIPVPKEDPVVTVRITDKRYIDISIKPMGWFDGRKNFLLMITKLIEARKYNEAHALLFLDEGAFGKDGIDHYAHISGEVTLRRLPFDIAVLDKIRQLIKKED